MNDTFAECAQKVFNVANSAADFFENNKDGRMFSKSTIMKTLAINTSSVQENIFIAVEDIYTQSIID